MNGDDILADYWDDLVTTNLTTASITSTGAISGGLYPNTLNSTVLTTGGGGGTLTTNSNGVLSWDAGHSHTWANITGDKRTSAQIFDSNGSGKIDLKGDKADITINGVSLTDRLADIERHLNILRPRKELEGSWDELRELREAYEAKLSEVLEAERIFGILKS